LFGWTALTVINQLRDIKSIPDHSA
jgi:hypothetical protein